MPDYTYQRANSSTSTKNDVDNNGNVYFEDGDGNMKSIDNTGSVRWTTTDVNGDGSAVRDFAVTPDGSEVIVHIYGEAWHILDGTNGNILTTIATTFSADTNNMVTIGNTREVYIHEFAGGFHHYDVGNDTSLKNFAPPNGSPSSGTQHIAFNSNHVYLGDDAGYIYELNRGDFSTSQSTQVATHDVEVQDVSDDGSFLIVNGFNLDESQAYHWGYDGAFNQIYAYTTNAALDEAYDGVDTESYTPSGDQSKILTYNENGTQTREYTDSSGEVEDIIINEDYNASKTIINRGFGEIAQIDDSEFAALLEAVTATQVSGAGTMNATTTTELAQVSATQVSAAGTMNTTVDNFTQPATQVASAATVNTASNTSYQAGATQFTSPATMISHGIPVQVESTATMNSAAVLEAATATQVGALATENLTQIRELNTRIFITDEGGNAYEASAILYEGQHPFFQEGGTTSLTLTFETAQYDTVRQNVGRYLNEDNVTVHQSFYSEPRYRQVIHPESPVGSYLWKFEPEAAIDELDTWWVVVTSIEDATRHYGDGEQLSVELLPLKRDEGETFTQISEEYEV